MCMKKCDLVDDVVRVVQIFGHIWTTSHLGEPIIYIPTKFRENILIGAAPKLISRPYDSGTGSNFDNHHTSGT